MNMKIGRNDPCPCGSGKKYKRCCLPGAQSTVSKNDDENTGFGTPESGLGEWEADLDKQKLGLGEQKLLFDLLNNLRRLSLDRKPHIKEYKKIRKLHSEIVNSMVEYYESGKFEQKIDPDYLPSFTPAHQKEGRKRGADLVLLESKFDVETREGVQALYNMLIYKSALNTSCITEDFIQKHRYRKPEKIEFLQSMLDSEAGLFEITGTDLIEGYAYLKEIFTGREYKITDIALSSGMQIEKFYMYTRIITYHNISFNTGLSLMFRKTDPFIKNYIKCEKKDYNPIAEFRRFIELYNRFSEDHNGIEVTANEY